MRSMAFIWNPGVQCGRRTVPAASVGDREVRSEGTLHAMRVRPETAKRPSTRPSGVVGGELVEQAVLLRREAAPGIDEVGTGEHGAAQRLGPAPAVDLAVVAGAQHLGHLEATERRRLGELRVLEETV